MNTTVFFDPLTNHFWFLLKGELLCAIAVPGSNLLCPAEVVSPELPTDYHREFVTKFLQDEDYQLNYTQHFFITDTQQLNAAIKADSKRNIELQPKYKY